MTPGVSAFWRTKHYASLTDDVFEPVLGAHNLLPNTIRVCPGEDDMIKGVRADLKSERQLADLHRMHCSVRCRPRNVERTREAILCEQLGDPTIQRMAIVPTGR